MLKKNLIYSPKKIIEKKSENTHLLDDLKTIDTKDKTNIESKDSIFESNKKIQSHPSEEIKENFYSDSSISEINTTYKKTLKQILLNRHITFRIEYNRIPINLESPILFKGLNDKSYKEYHLSLNKEYLVLYSILDNNKKKQKLNSLHYRSVSEINLHFKNIYDIYHPKFCINFNLMTVFLTINSKTKEIILNILSTKILIFKLKIPNQNNELFTRIINVLQSQIQNSRGYYMNLFGISLRKDFSYNYFIKASEFEYKAKTGDILLFKGFEFSAKLQRLYTKKDYDHVAILRKKNGILYVYEATTKDGCKERKWQEFINYLWNLLYDKMVFRELIIKTDSFEERNKIEKYIDRQYEDFLKNTQGKNYKMYLCTICCGSHKKKSQENNLWKNKKGFICSSLIMGAYLQMGICKYTKNVNEILPGEFSQDFLLPFTDKFELGPEIIIDFSL